MRIVHATDIHWRTRPSVRQLSPKRWVGSANLTLLGRARLFSAQVQAALTPAMMALQPDVALITGDLTAQALPEEFAAAREALGPLITSRPSLVLPGNHDVYTRGAQRENRFQSWFGAWSPQDATGLRRLDAGPLTVFGLDPNRPTLFGATGEVPPEQLKALVRALDDPSLRDRELWITCHYPLVGRDGQLYDRGGHALVNAAAVRDALKSATFKPSLWLHGHLHHGYVSHLDLGGHPLTTVNCGSSGQAWLPSKGIHASFGVFERQAPGQWRYHRQVWDGSGFVPEESVKRLGRKE